MPAVLARALAAGAMLACAQAPAAPVAAIDDRGVTVTLTAPALRILAISPHLVELAHAAGAGARLVGAVRGADFPAEAAGLPLVGDAYGIDHERLLALKPDLVLAWGSGNRAADLDRIEHRGIPLFVAEPRHLDDVARHLRAIGTLAGTAAAAESAAQAFVQERARQRARAVPRAGLSAFVEIWPQPLFTVGSQHLISEVIGLCGLRNALHDYPLASGPVPMEAVLAARPDVIVSVSGFGKAALRERWSGLHSLKAADAIVDIDPDLLTRATPRLLDGSRALCAALDQIFTH